VLPLYHLNVVCKISRSAALPVNCAEQIRRPPAPSEIGGDQQYRSSAGAAQADPTRAAHRIGGRWRTTCRTPVSRTVARPSLISLFPALPLP
jgi:hypothetical protein